jgi:hypothetical protein
MILRAKAGLGLCIAHNAAVAEISSQFAAA